VEDVAPLIGEHVAPDTGSAVDSETTWALHPYHWYVGTRRAPVNGAVSEALATEPTFVFDGLVERVSEPVNLGFPNHTEDAYATTEPVESVTATVTFDPKSELASVYEEAVLPVPVAALQTPGTAPTAPVITPEQSYH